MKRVVLVVFFIVALCSLCLVINTGTVSAYKAGYSVDDYVATITPTMDGKWTTTDEWTDAQEVHLEGSLNAIFRLKYVSNYPTSVNQYYLIEFFGDNTNDAGDYLQICYASAATFGGTPIGGTTPQTDCLRIDYVGHTQTGLALYKGTGTGWSPSADYTWGTTIQIVDSISASPLDSTPHWIAEIMIEHIHYNIQPEFWIRVAVYDASRSAAGVQAWPASSVDVPNDWGLMNALQTVIPETFPIGVMLVLSSVAVIVGSRYFRKGTRIKSYSQKKLEK
jgi:hypothetical protein